MSKTTRNATDSVSAKPQTAAKTPTEGPKIATPTPIDRIEKAVGRIIMLAVENDGARFFLKDADYEFFVSASHDNYAAMFSLLLAAQNRADGVAVKYSTIDLFPQPNRRAVKALATGAGAVISGTSF